METLFEGLHAAIVVDNDDPDQLGRVKIRPLIEGVDYNTDHLPWARPLFQSSGGSDSHGLSDIPENNSKVWVTYEKFKTRKNPHYLFDATENSLNVHGKFLSDIKSNITGFQSGYPDVKFRLYANGICIGVSSNSTNKEIFTYHPSGSHTFIDKDGKMFINSVDELSVHTNTKKTRLENNWGYIELKDTNGQVDINGNLTIDV